MIKKHTFYFVVILVCITFALSFVKQIKTNINVFNKV